MHDLDYATEVAEKYRDILAPHCHRIAVAGSIRRRTARMVKDIELVAVPLPYEPAGIFEDGIAAVINRLPKLKGELPCLYTKRILPEGITLDLFMCRPDNWGLILMIRTGHWQFSKRMVGTWLPQQGIKSVNGDLIDIKTGEVLKTPEEEDVFKFAKMTFIEPKNRE